MAGLNKRTLTVSVGGTDYTAQVSKCSISSAARDSDFTTFADAAAGGARDYFLNVVAVQDMATGTFWDKVWTAVGTSVAVIVKPYGNAAASVAQPHYSGNVTVKEPDGDLVGGEADASVTARQVIEVSWPFDAKPTKVTV